MQGPSAKDLEEYIFGEIYELGEPSHITGDNFEISEDAGGNAVIYISVNAWDAEIIDPPRRFRVQVTEDSP